MSFLGLVPLAKTLPVGTLSVLSILLSFLDVADAFCHSPVGCSHYPKERYGCYKLMLRRS
jgi:hypothetical protein